MGWRMGRWVIALAIGVLMASPGYAQLSQGRLAGVVTDAQGAVLPGVTVTATSPSLIGVQTTVTQADGRYMFPSLPSGTYKVSFDLAGFKKVERDNIAVVLGQTFSFDTTLEVGTLTESVTVTGDSPLVDVSTTKIGTNLKGEELIAVPTSTDVWGALSMSPGVRMAGFDVGGSHKSQQSGYEVFGVQSQARTVSDGVDHTEGVGGTGFYEDYYANEEVSVSALGSDVEMNSGGAAIVTTIKSGGNTFRGLEHLSYEPGSFVGSNADPSSIQSKGYTCPNNAEGQPQCDNPNLLFWEGHLDLGGPIKRDKAWFYGAYNHFKIDKQVAGISRDVATDLGIFDNYTAKGTWKPSTNNTVIGYFQQGRKQKPKRGLSNLLPPESVRAQDSYSRMYKGEYQRVINDRTFFNVNVGNFTLDWPMVVQVDPAQRPPQVFRATNAVAGAGWNAFSSNRKKPQLKAQLTHYLPNKGGSHDFKFGFEVFEDNYRYGHNGRSGQIRYSYAGVDASQSPDRIRFVDTGDPAGYGTDWTVGPTLDRHYSGYAQDRWSPNERLTFTLGVRLDKQRVGYGDAVRKPLITDVLADGSRIFPTETTVAGQTLVNNTNVAPRLGVTYDLTGKGRTVLKAFYGRYYNNIADSFTGANPGGQAIAEYNFLDQNHNGRYDGPSELGTERLRTGGTATSVDPGYKTPSAEEISASFETQLPGESSARFTYVRKNIKDAAPYYVTNVVPAWLGQNTIPVTRTIEGETFNLVDVPDSLGDQSAQVYQNFPDGTFNYDTIEFAYNKRVSQKFFINASADYLWRSDFRSPLVSNGYDISTSPLSADPIGINYYVYANPAVQPRQETTAYHIQFLGRYELPAEIGFSANYRYQSGYQYSRIIPDCGCLNLSNYGADFFVEPLKNNRADNAGLLNFRVDKSFKVSWAKISAMLDIYNVTNADPVTNFNLNSGSGYKRVIATLDPRVFQMGFRLEF
ncbi:MAG TPA: carboxypeptidase regulatory-like domain-containing protein [Vicinamibacterales bacterium]|nr:carboxypeptidase regulatory-like domain-containing protein [Vicinamibacterales bacterium]